MRYTMLLGTVVAGLAGLYFHIPYSGWVLAAGLVGVFLS